MSARQTSNPERNKLRDVVKGDAKKLAARAHKYLTMSAEYAERRAWAKKKNEPEAPYAQRLNALAPCTRQLQCKPFESGRNTLPGMEAFAPYRCVDDVTGERRKA